MLRFEIYTITYFSACSTEENILLKYFKLIIYREDMEKVNIVFHNNGTVSYQHKKILNFVPEMSKDKNLKVIVPNIPLLVSKFFL